MYINSLAVYPSPFPPWENPMHALVQNMNLGQLLNMFMPESIFMFVVAHWLFTVWKAIAHQVALWKSKNFLAGTTGLKSPAILDHFCFFPAISHKFQIIVSCIQSLPVIAGYFRSFTNISGHFRSLPVIFISSSHFRSLQVVSNHFRSLPVIKGRNLSFPVFSGH